MEENKIEETTSEIESEVETKNTEFKFCPKCGAKLQESAKFCTKCGTLIKNNDCAIDTTAPFAEEAAVQPLKSNKKKNKKIAIIVSSVVLIIAIIAGVVFGVRYLNNSKMEDEITGVWLAEAIIDGDEYHELYHGLGLLDYKLVLEDDLHGYIYLSSSTDKSENIDFSWEYYESDDKYDYFKVKAGGNTFALMSYDKGAGILCFVLNSEDGQTIVYTRE